MANQKPTLREESWLEKLGFGFLFLVAEVLDTLVLHLAFPSQRIILQTSKLSLSEEMTMNWQWLKELFSWNEVPDPATAEHLEEVLPASPQAGTELGCAYWDGMDASSEGPFHRNPDGRMNARR